MKSTFAVRLCWLFGAVLWCSTASTVLAQESKAPAPPFEIIKIHWEKQVRLPRNFDPSVIPTATAFNDPASRISSTLGNTDGKNIAPNNRNPTLGTTPLGFPPVPPRVPVFYVYSLKIKNLGPKAISGVAWDYLFVDPNTKIELGRHSFLSYEALSENKVATVKGQSRSSPIRIIRTSNSEQHARAKLRAEVAIQCLLYADDTVWKSASAPEGTCELLRSQKNSIKNQRNLAPS